MNKDNKSASSKTHVSIIEEEEIINLIYKENTSIDELNLNFKDRSESFREGLNAVFLLKTKHGCDTEEKYRKFIAESEKRVMLKIEEALKNDIIEM
jgi:hypothetical protein